jgi:hypothetical protein
MLPALVKAQAIVLAAAVMFFGNTLNIIKPANEPEIKEEMMMQEIIKDFEQKRAIKWEKALEYAKLITPENKKQLYKEAYDKDGIAASDLTSARDFLKNPDKYQEESVPEITVIIKDKTLIEGEAITGSKLDINWERDYGPSATVIVEGTGEYEGTILFKHDHADYAKRAVEYAKQLKEKYPNAKLTIDRCD